VTLKKVAGVEKKPRYSNKPTDDGGFSWLKTFPEMGEHGAKSYGSS
jgi:hypothetical protein